MKGSPHMKMPSAPLALAAALLLSACASAPGGNAIDRSVLTREEIVAANQTTALQLVQSERPQWLYRRGSRTISGDTDVAVYLDGTRIGGPEVLAEIPASNVERMRHYTDREAQFRWGVGHLHGAIEVITARR
ncbi:MAG TPA: hypothetical protein VMM12_16415 [Longimicrobiales bacterium]|nr:hypothetical protein [Longimicrobiales bacterium]